MGSFAVLLAGIAPHYIDRPVVDKTNLKGKFDLALDWTLDVLLHQNGGLTIFDALRNQLGLKLERRTELTPVVVVDRVDRISE